MGLFAFLDRDHIVAPAGFSRWLVPPAALCIHLCIGEVYAFSVFNLPLTRLIGLKASAPGDWSLVDVGWIFSVAILFLGLASAFTGSWLDRVGPRKAMTAAALCFGGGFLIGALGIEVHNLPLLFLGYGVLGGCGLGIGYISPVRTLITWFPDRPGMATGMAIMGFGGGAMIASPLSVALMHHYATPTSLGVAPTFVTLGIVYAVFMLIGAAIVRVPPPGWRPAGYMPAASTSRLISDHHYEVSTAVRTPQFYLLWAILFLNVTAGIGVLSQASPMIQEMFHGNVTPVAAAGFVGLLSLFNMAGRFFWASVSDYIGRKATYFVFFLLGLVLYASVPSIARAGSIALFVLCYGIILSMYGGGFSTIPAYLKDLFGTSYVGAIHGRLLTAWSAAGVLGPVLVDYIRQYQIAQGVDKADAYSVTMYIMAGLLLIGALCNLAVGPVGTHIRHISAPAE
ncbi:MAG TPA: OFA family MFS transporter [Acidocella sp.]|jgi:MFS family permease|uniref:L-lactate MFS transporter n=1 Tax=Acidocella sp. TaxID=50710 RepID=UPI002BB8F212|nr:OFA family MFS transporter [Acidocella sp.]HVE21906.1 OFA family MFS transporter [Acidocella sp.]